MDYKSVLEEQISKLQKIQEQNINDGIQATSEIINISNSILKIIQELRQLNL